MVINSRDTVHKVAIRNVQRNVQLIIGRRLVLHRLFMGRKKTEADGSSRYKIVPIMGPGNVTETSVRE